MEPEFTLIGGILRFERLAEVVRRQLASAVNLPSGDLVQYASALGAAVLGRQRVRPAAAGAGAGAGAA
jgi:hypothetical protein